MSVVGRFLLKKADAKLVGTFRSGARFGLSRCRTGHRNELGKLSEVLSGGCEDELVTRTVRSSKSQAIEPENAFQMREQHLDLLAKPT